MMFGTVITEPTGSHVPQLEEAARAATGLVIEHGAGLYSTHLLARLGCRVLCCESNAGWAEWARWAYDGRGEVVDSLGAVIARLPEASLVFIDGPETERSDLVTESLAARVPVIVAHDTHPRAPQPRFSPRPRPLMMRSGRRPILSLVSASLKNPHPAGCPSAGWS